MIYIIFTNKLFHYLKEKVIVMRKNYVVSSFVRCGREYKSCAL